MLYLTCVLPVRSQLQVEHKQQWRVATEEPGSFLIPGVFP